jgi:alkylation response protein AidB-like acyl-CoA dehydrogenase
MEASELELFRRGIRRATETCGDEALDAALDELGWRDALVADRSIAVSLLFEAQGSTVVDSSALDWLLAAALGAEDGGRTSVVLPLLRRTAPPGRVRAGRCEVHGLGTRGVARADETVVVAEADGGPVAFTVKAASLELRQVRGLDPALGIVEVTGDFDPAAGRAVDWEAAASAGQLAVAHELVGLARAMLELARQHALDRVQFGRPISSFQAIRHRLAESLVAVEAADGLLAAAWEDPSPVMAAMAKGLAGRSARAVARHAQQVLAGIGFTTEHPLHRYVRRTIVIDQLLGASSVLTRQLGEDVLERGTLPPTLPL